LDGLDEVTLAEKTVVAEAQDGLVKVFELSPENFGLRPSSLVNLAVEDAEASARIIREVFSEGRDDAARDLILANAAAGLLIGGAAADLREATRLAAASIDTGAASAKLAELVKATTTGVGA
jgi:anthranilate phosphoribosyltransferase